MPLDTSIYRAIPQIQVKSPLERYGQIAQIQGAQQQNALGGLQLQQAQRAMDDQAAARQVFSLPEEQRRNALAQINPELAYKYDENQLKINQGQSLQEKQRLDSEVTKAKLGRDMIASATPETWGSTVKRAQELGMAWAQSAPAQYDPQWAEKSIYDADNWTKAKEAQLGRDVTIRGQDKSQETAYRGQDMSRDTAYRGQDMTARTAANGQQITMRGQNMQDNRARQTLGVNSELKDLQAQKIGMEIEQAKKGRQGAADTYNVAIDSLDNLYSQDEKGKEKSHPGLESSVGANFSGFLGMNALNTNRFPIPGTDKADFLAQLDTFKSQVFLPMVQNLKGMGALSDAEGKKLSAAVGALDPSMSEKAFKASVVNIKKNLIAARDRAIGDVKSIPELKVGAQLNSMPDPSSAVGVVIKDDSGIHYKSDGTSWKRIN